MDHKIVPLLVLFLIPLSCFSQQKKAFHIGDSMPPMTFTNIFNSPGTSISLEDYKGKLIILDFWNRWCGSCIEAFPKMEKLQQEFGDKIKILLVTGDKNNVIEKLFTKVRQPSLPIISGDSVLSSMFPHITVPHHVWVNPDNHIQFITDGYNATANNVSKVLDAKEIELPIKTELTDVDVEADLWREGKGRFQKYITNYSFVMSKIKENWHNGFSFSIDTIRNTMGFKLVNIALLDFYKVAFGGSIDYMLKDFSRNNRVQIVGTQLQNFFDYPVETDSIPAWEDRNIVSYESKWKIHNDSLAYKYLQDDANRFFPFFVTVENEVVSCYILKKTPDFKGTKSKKTKKFFEYTDSSYILKNMPVFYLTESLNGIKLFEKSPVVDETNFHSNIDLNLKNALTNMVTLKKQLLQNGLLLEEGKRKIRMLVIAAK